MRRTVFVLGWLLCPAALPAAPVPAGQPAAATAASPAQLQAAARDYAANLLQVLQTVETNYVRPVGLGALTEAALTGLYEAAGVPVPGGLKAAVKKAEKENALDKLLVQTRVALGNPEALQGRKALLASCRAVMRSLDPFCAVLTGEEAATAGGYDQNFGLGIDLVEKSGLGPLIIKAVVPGGPAQRAGLQPGDHILAVDGKPTKALSTEQGLQLLNGGAEEAGDARNIRKGMPPPIRMPEDAGGTPSPARLTVRGAGDRAERTLTLVRDHFEAETVQGVGRQEDNSWDYWLDRKKRIAHVRIVTLARHTNVELERVLARLEGGEGLRGLVLDLRWCPGGYLNSATGAAELFLEDGVVARTKGRTDGEHVIPVRGGERKFTRFPVVVLVNGETTGGGELIAAALQDHKRAAVAGQRTRGKGSIQSPLELALLRDGGAAVDGILELKLTSGTFVRPSGKALNRFADSKPSDDWGVRPDPKLEFRVSADFGRRLKDWWQEQALRPGSSDKGLPLDDPVQDPQRQAALKALLSLMGEKK
jgi:carboxyl-terminal processing protease